MSSELVNIKQEWFNNIKSYITSRDFQETDFGYERTKIVREPGQTISINGHVMQQPGKEIEIKNIIRFQGDGWVANMDDTNKMDFSQIKFETYQNDNLVMEYEDMFYWDESEYFINIFNQAFRV